MRGVWLVVMVACSSAPPSPVPAREIVTSADVPMAIAVDGDAIFWVTQTGDLFSAPKTGTPISAPIHITDVGTNTGSQIALGEGAIHVATAMDGLYRVDRITSNVTQIDTGFVTSVATTFGGDVYWSTNALLNTAPAVKRMVVGASTEVLSTAGSMAIALDSAGAYWIDGYWMDWCVCLDPCDKSAQVPLHQRSNDGTITTLGMTTPSYGVLAADGESLYASDMCAGTITRFDHVSGAATLLASGFENVSAIAIDDRDVYAVYLGKEGFFDVVGDAPAILRVPKNGGPVTQIATRDRTPLAVALDDTTIYFIAFDRPAQRYGIFAIAKPRP